MEAAPRLRIVPETGEVLCPNCAVREDEIAGLVKKMRGLAREVTELRRDKQAEAMANPLWPEAAALFVYWRERCDHPNSQWTLDRFELVAPLLKAYGRKVCEQAIRGAAFDPFTTKRKNGREKKHDGWELIFRSAEKMEDFAARSPGLARHDGIEPSNRVLETQGCEPARAAKA